MVDTQEFVNRLKNKEKKTSFNITHEELEGKLDLTEFTKLKWLNCSDNELTNLDLSQNNDLESINAAKNKLKNLDWLADLPQKDKLKSLNLFGNEIEEVDFSLLTAFSNLESINLSNNPLNGNNLNLTDLNDQQLSLLEKWTEEGKIKISDWKGNLALNLLQQLVESKKRIAELEEQIKQLQQNQEQRAEIVMEKR